MATASAIASIASTSDRIPSPGTGETTIEICRID